MQDEGTVEQDASAGMSVGDRVLHSDPHDFAGLYIRHRASFTLHARRYLRDARDADEVVQEAFLRLFLALPELETELQALAYCRRTITNLCIDRFRAQARRPSLVDLDSAGALDLAQDDPGDPVVRAEDAATVRAALSLLSPLHRAALVKREIEEKTLPVIAEELEIPEESVKHVLFRARRALRRILERTSLAPGSDAEIAGALGRAARASSGGLAAFVLLLFLGLGTGPDLRAIPVVGADFPEVIPVTQIASAVGDAVSVVADEVASVVTSSSDARSDSGQPAADEPVAGGGPAPLAAPSPSSSPAPGALAAAGASPAPVPSPAAAVPAPSSSPSPAPLPTTEPTQKPTQKPTQEPTPAPAPASPKAAASSSPEPAPEPTSSSARTSGGAARGKEPKSSPSPSSEADPQSYQTDGLEYVEDSDGTMVLVPLGQSAEGSRN